MTRKTRSYLGLLLAFLLALTSQSMAVARGMPNAAGEVVLCTGYGPMVVMVDETGQPVGAPHICPDFAASLFAYAPEPPLTLTRPQTRALALRPPARIAAVSLEAPKATARGPPARA